MKLDFLMLADGANVADGKVYIHGGAVTRATFAEFPSNPMFLTAVARFLLEPDEINSAQVRHVAFEVSRKDGTTIEVGAGELRWEPGQEIREGEDQATVLVAPMMVIFESPGRYELSLRLDGQEVGTRGLLAVRREDEAPTIQARS